MTESTMESKDTSSDYGKKCIACDVNYEIDKAKCPKCELPLTPVSNELAQGSVIGEKYEIESLVGDGGMGKVYKAAHKLMKRKVAIKMLHSGLVSQAATLKRFKKEAEASSKLDHTNLVTTLDFGLTPDGRPYLVMDYLEGISFAELLSREKVLKPEHCLKLFVQICAGLEHAHTKGIIHRDIKPNNIFVVEDAKQNQIIKILDFGIAKRVASKDDDELNDTRNSITEAGTVFGSPLYMSPEQIRGAEVDFRSDVYSVSCLLYQSLTGTPVYEVEDALDCMQLHINKKPEPFSHRCSTAGIPDSLQQIVFRGLEKDPEKRIQSMEEYGELLAAELAKLTQPKQAPAKVSESEESESKNKDDDSRVETEESKDSKDSVESSDGNNESEKLTEEPTGEKGVDGETQPAKPKKKEKFSFASVSNIAVPLLVVVALVALSSFTDTRLFYEEDAKSQKVSESATAKSVDEELESLPAVEDAGKQQKADREPLQLPVGKDESEADKAQAETAQSSKEDDGRVRLSTLIREGKQAYRREDFVQAQKSFIEANKIAHKLDVRSIEYLDSVTWLGKTLMARKKYRAALNYLEWSRDKIEVRYGTGSRFAREARDLLTICYKKLGMNKKA